MNQVSRGTKNTSLNIRIKGSVKNEAVKVLDKLNLTLSEAVGMYLQQIVLRGGIPFTITLPDQHMPNAETIKSIEDSERNFDKLPRYKDIDSFMEAIDK